MDVRSKSEFVVTVAFNEREAKLLSCLVGAIGTEEAEKIIKRGINFNKWIGRLEKREVTDFTGTLYDALHGLF